MGQEGAAVFVVIALVFLLVWFAVVVHGFVRVLGGRISTLVPLSDVATMTLQRNFAYYARADAWQRWRIRRRVQHLIADKEWIGRGLEVTRDMKAMVAACAIQLMWGWKDADMLFFRRVIIYPDRFRTRMNDQDHVGELNPGFGVLAISWKHFIEGYREGGDGRNLGLHEMGHALWVGMRKESGYMAEWDLRHWREWYRLAEEEAARIRAGNGRLFRAYAGTDQAEFFAVAVEYFFEQPATFKAQVPELYACLCELLRQDPAAWAV